MSDQELFTAVVKEMVKHPDEVEVQRKSDEIGVLLTLKVNPEDLGQIIGKQGQTAKALRVILRVIGAKNHARLSLQIFEPDGARRRRDDHNQMITEF